MLWLAENSEIPLFSFSCIFTSYLLLDDIFHLGTRDEITLGTQFKLSDGLHLFYILIYCIKFLRFNNYTVAMELQSPEAAVADAALAHR